MIGQPDCLVRSFMIFAGDVHDSKDLSAILWCTLPAGHHRSVTVCAAGPILMYVHVRLQAAGKCCLPCAAGVTPGSGSRLFLRE